MADGRKVPLVNIVRADMKPVVRELARIADALEVYLQIAHGYNMRVPTAVPDDGEERSSLAYYSDLEAVKQEVEAAMKGDEAANDV